MFLLENKAFQLYVEHTHAECAQNHTSCLEFALLHIVKDHLRQFYEFAIPYAFSI